MTVNWEGGIRRPLIDFIKKKKYRTVASIRLEREGRGGGGGVGGGCGNVFLLWKWDEIRVQEYQTLDKMANCHFK